MSGVHVFHPTVVLYGSNTAVVSDLTGQIAAEELHGLFAGDTRVLFSYKFDVNGCAWRLLARSRLGHGGAQWQFQNPEMRDAEGERWISVLLRLPRAPSANSVYFARSSMPRVKLSLRRPSLATPMSPVATPAIAPLLSNSGSAAANPG